MLCGVTPTGEPRPPQTDAAAPTAAPRPAPTTRGPPPTPTPPPAEYLRALREDSARLRRAAQGLRARLADLERRIARRDTNDPPAP